MSEESAKVGPHVDETMVELFGPGVVEYAHECGCSLVVYERGARDTTACEAHARERFMRGAK